MSRNYIRDKITKEQWSPAQIAGHLRKKGEKCVCVETIYAYIRADRAAGGDLWKHCRHQLKHRKRQASQPYRAVQDRTMIDERPPEWDGSTPGDFEMDTIVGKDGKGAIVTLVERNTSFTMAMKLPEGKNAEVLAQMVITMLIPYIGKILSSPLTMEVSSPNTSASPKDLKPRYISHIHTLHGRKDALSITTNS